MQKLLLIFYHSENRATGQIWKILPNMVFPPIWGEKMAAFWACACKLSWTLLSHARVQPLYGAGRKESSGTGLMYPRLKPWLAWCAERVRTKGGEIRDTKTLNLTCNIVSLQVFVDVSRFSPCMINLSRKLLRKEERGSTLSNKFWLCCSFFIKHTTCCATNLLVP